MKMNIVIKKISKVPDNFINQLNQLFDEGVVWDKEQGSKFLGNPDNALFLGFLDDVVAGFLTAHRLQRFDRKKAEVLLYEIGVDEKFQRKGVGRALIENVKNWAREIEAGEVWVLTERSNLAAMALYTSCGGVEETHGDEVMLVMKVSE
jgi:GNAT superfamily N-acetyltransferase